MCFVIGPDHSAVHPDPAASRQTSQHEDQMTVERRATVRAGNCMRGLALGLRFSMPFQNSLGTELQSKQSNMPEPYVKP